MKTIDKDSRMITLNLMFKTYKQKSQITLKIFCKNMNEYFIDFGNNRMFIFKQSRKKLYGR